MCECVSVRGGAVHKVSVLRGNNEASCQLSPSGGVASSLDKDAADGGMNGSVLPLDRRVHIHIHIRIHIHTYTGQGHRSQVTEGQSVRKKQQAKQLKKRICL